MNKNEYYIFSKNLKAQIAIDEEKANNGEVDAMIRLARYFRTGETLGKPLFSLDENAGERLGCYWFDEEENIRECYDDDDSVTKEDLVKSEKYAKMAMERGDDRGQYEYVLLLGKRLAEQFEGDYGGGPSIAECWLNELEESEAYEPSLGEIFVKVSDGEEEYRLATEEEFKKIHKDWADGYAETLEEYEKYVDGLRQVEAETMALLLDLAQRGFSAAQLELGQYFYNAAFPCTPKGCIYSQVLPLESKTTQEVFDEAIKYLEDALVCQDKDIIQKASLMLAEIYACKGNEKKDIQKAITYYNQSACLDEYHAERLLNFYLQNNQEVEFDWVLTKLPNTKYAISGELIGRILEEVSAETLRKSCRGVLSLIKNTFSYIENISPQKIIDIFEEKDLVDFCVKTIEKCISGFGQYGIGVSGDDLHTIALENGLELEEGCGSTELVDYLREKNRMICAAIYNAREYDYYYQILKTMIDNNDEYAQYKWGQFLHDLSFHTNWSGSGDVENFFVFGKDISGLLDENSCRAIAKELLVQASQNGNIEALVKLGQEYDEHTLRAYQVLKSNGKIDELLNLRIANVCFEREEYEEASKFLEEGFYNTLSKTLFAEELLRCYEQISSNKAKEYVESFFDLAIEKGICEECFEFVNDNLVPSLLDKESDYYNPSYAIRILQSPEFSSTEGYYKLGCIFCEGEHAEKDIKKALKYLKRAGKEGVGEAYYRLAYLYYYGDDGLNPELLRAKEYFEKAIFSGFNCEYAYEMVRADLNEKDDVNPMKDYADIVIAETPRGKERNARLKKDIANEFGEYWEKLNENTRGFIYSGIKTYVDNYEDDDPIYDFSTAINPMAKSLETLLGDIFYTKYKEWLLENGVDDIKTYFESIGVRMSSDKDPFELGVFRFVAYERKIVDTDYETARKYIRENKLPAIIRKSGKTICKLQLHEKFAEYANEIFKEDAFSSDERIQEIAAFIINLISQVEVIREDLRNRASHDTVMKAMHAEKCGNILYKTKKILYNLISKIND